MTGTDPIRVLLVDDHPVVREGLAAIIERQPDFVLAGEAADGGGAIAQYERLHPDVVLMDLRLPNVSGEAAIREIRRLDPAARIIALTGLDSDGAVFSALQAGACGYLLKDAPREELVEGIRAAHAGLRVLAVGVGQRLAERMSRPELTERELEVLQLMTSGLTNREIAVRFRITEGTVKSHINRILAKLEADDRTQAVTTALRRGLVELD